MPKVGDIYESFRSSEFIVEINTVKSPSISKISGLSEGEIDTVEQPNGGTGHIHKIAGSVVKYEPITIERYMDGSTDDKLFQDWVKESFGSPTNNRGGSAARRNGMIFKMHNGEVVLKFAFYFAWLKSSKFTDLEAGSNNLLKQTIVLEHEGLERVP